MPWQLGPMTPMLYSRAMSASCCCKRTPSPPVSEKPELKMITYGTPFLPQLVSMSTTREALTRINASSGASGKASIEGQHFTPPISWYLGLIG